MSQNSWAFSPVTPQIAAGWTVCRPQCHYMFTGHGFVLRGYSRAWALPKHRGWVHWWCVISIVNLLWPLSYHVSYVCRVIVLCVPGSGRYTLNCGKCTACLLSSSLCQGRCRLAKPKESVMARSLIPDCRLMEWLLKRNTRLPRWRNRLQGKGMAMAMNGYQDKVHMHGHMHDCEQRLKHGLKFKCI